MENVIEFKHVYKSFGDFQLKDISMTVKKGFITVLSVVMVLVNLQRLNL